jgi:hypothetical protein
VNKNAFASILSYSVFADAKIKSNLSSQRNMIQSLHIRRNSELEKSLQSLKPSHAELC